LATDGAVLYGPELTDDDAVQRRLRGKDIVVRGPDKAENLKRAKEIETRVGGPTGRWFREEAHRREGPSALPHLHQETRVPTGHTFYEVDKRKARKKR
jgi:hypothetical protein